MQLQHVRDLLHQVYDIRERQSLTLHYLLVILRSHILQLLVCLHIVIQNKILLFPLPRHTFDIRHLVLQIFQPNIYPFILLTQNHHHDVTDPQLPKTRLPEPPTHIEVVHIKVIDVELRIGLKKALLVVQRKGQSFKRLVKQLHILLRRTILLLRMPLLYIPIKHILGTVSHIRL